MSLVEIYKSTYIFDINFQVHEVGNYQYQNCDARRIQLLLVFLNILERDFIIFIRFHFMGCIASQFDTPVTLYGSKSPIIANLSEPKKDKIVRLIQKDNILELAVAMSELGASPNSEVSDPNIRWMMTHLCCRWDADNCLQYLLKDYFCSNPLNYIDFINAPTSEGYTCLHICAMWKAEKCFYVLHYYGGLNLNAKDRMLKTPYETAIQYSKQGRMRLTLTNYRQMNVNFTHVEGQKLISGNMIAQDIGTEMKKKQDQKKNQMKDSLVKKTETANNSVLNLLSDLEKNMLEQKKKLQKEKQEILQSKLKQQLQSDAKKAQLLAQNSKKQVEQFEKIQHEKKIKEQIDLQLKKQQQKLAGQLKAKQDELNKVKDELKKKEQERILKQKQQAEKRTQQFMLQKQQEINQKVKQKQDALNNLKKQQQERARKEKQDAERKLKQVQQAYNKKEEEMNRKLKQKEQEVISIKQQQQERLRKEKQNTQQMTQQAIKKSQQQYNRKLKQKEQEVRKYKEQQAYRLQKQKEEAEKRAIEQAKDANKLVNNTTNQINQNVNNAKNTANTVAENVNKVQSNLSSAVNQIREAYKKIKEQIPADIEKMYVDAKNAGAYFDSEFPATNKSIGDPSKSNFANFTTNTVWLRPKQILKADFKVFDGIDPNDIKQGSLGVCYMLASLSALAQTPKNIQKMFIFSDTSIGFYVLRFYVNGRPKFITVDDLIPCNKTTKSPLFTKPIGNQIWVLLLEKAWAKLIGDYLSAQSMTPDHMMEDLSAAPSFGSWFQKQGKPNSEHIKTIVKHDKMGHIVVITSGQKKIQGIANNHAYTMLQSYEYNGRIIFKVRNPWGQFEWNGEYGDKSSLWTPELKTLVKYQNKDDGVFHLSENELTNAFCYYSISQISDNNLYSFTQFTSKRHQDLFFTLKLQKTADVNIRVTQLFDRMIRDKSYKYSPFVFEVGKINSDNNVKFISEGHQKSYFGAKSVHAFENIVQNLEAGSYFIRIKMLWQDQTKYNKAVLAVYAPEYIKIQRLPNDKGIKYMKALFYSFASKIQKNPTGDGFYKISTMKGQFVLIGETDKEGKHQLKISFNKDKMQMAQLDLGKVSETQVDLFFSKAQPGIATAMRTDPAKGGTTGPCSILVQKVG